MRSCVEFDKRTASEELSRFLFSALTKLLFNKTYFQVVVTEIDDIVLKFHSKLEQREFNNLSSLVKCPPKSKLRIVNIKLDC